MNEARTFAACLTPAGAGAIATIAVRGPLSLDIVHTLSHDGKGTSIASRSLILGRFGGETVDQIVLAVKQTEPIPQIELHCHGGREVVRMILETLKQRGIEIVSWQQFVRLSAASSNRAEAAIQLTQARTVRTAAILLDQYRGAFDNAVDQVLQAIDANDQASADTQMAQLARHAPIGRHLTQPWRVVIAGVPNVGKSSLVNALAGYQRSVVSPISGTTRDVVGVEIAIDGWPIHLLDTAGVRQAGEALEQEGIRQAQETIHTADLCLWLLDASEPPVWPDELLPNMAWVINKGDLAGAWDLGRVKDPTLVSATSGLGLPDLIAAVVGRLISEAPAPGIGLPFTAMLCAQVEEAQRLWRDLKGEEARNLLAKLRFG